MNKKIPKVINYCWFGGNEFDDKVKKCILSWKRKAPDYKIVQWNETNFDINNTPLFVQKAYKAKKWAFVSDFVRLKVIYDNGGVYLDTDVELLKNLNVLTDKYACFMGFEDAKQVNTGLGFGALPRNPIIYEMLEEYENIDFDEGDLGSLSCPIINTKILKIHGLKTNNKKQKVNDIVILPTEYLCPQNMFTGETNITSNTVSIHHYNASWMNKKDRLKMHFIISMKKALPPKIVNFLRRTVRKYKK
ncbi:hypothetical protein IMAU20067_01028 [Lactobacillus helveticus]|uniref:glycosyltransferase family 32 protein n=1 Tax=Lactobacillus helveticus TaxID=1587 RepID=UPI001561CDF9|nr:glycosyltransferase [Lactobacillus helveticus]NRO74186.1 hypothetical protein [Lactobacillus helveticus]